MMLRSAAQGFREKIDDVQGSILGLQNCLELVPLIIFTGDQIGYRLRTKTKGIFRRFSKLKIVNTRPHAVCHRKIHVQFLQFHCMFVTLCCQF
jgi:hypothetical protein